MTSQRITLIGRTANTDRHRFGGVPYPPHARVAECRGIIPDGRARIELAINKD